MWSRLGAGSITSTAPLARRPAKRIADLTCAHARSFDEANAVEAAASDRHRKRRRSSVRAPIDRSGASTRSIGRLLNDASPVKVTLIGKPAAAPISSRAPVPLLPQSIGSAGLRHSAPWTSHSPCAETLDLLRRARERRRPYEARRRLRAGR